MSRHRSLPRRVPGLTACAAALAVVLVVLGSPAAAVPAVSPAAVTAAPAAVTAAAVPRPTPRPTAGGAAPGVPGVVQYPQYWFSQWGVPRIWDGGDLGQGITVAVIDTGVQASIADLSGSVLPGTDLTGLGGDGETDRDRSRFDHGTAMAALIAGHGGRYLAGVAPASKILPIAVPLVGTNQGVHSPGYVADAVRYAADHGAKVISMSLGGLRYPGEDDVACPSDTQSAILYALDKGAIVVAAGGNSGLRGSPTEEPGVCLGVVAVAAVDSRRAVANFSSRHPYLTVAAPGVDIPTVNAENAIYVGNGTSQATALTSGALALIWAAHPHETNRQITARLIAGARDDGPRGVDATYGYGTVDPAGSISARTGPGSVNPVFTRADPFLSSHGPAAAAALSKPAAAATAAPPAGYVAARPAEAGRPWVTWAAATVGALGLLGLVLLLLTRRQRPAPQSPPLWPGPSRGFAPPRA